MGEYKQIRISFNPNNDEDIVAFEYLKNLGRKSSQYMINLILSDLKGESTSINQLSDDTSYYDSLKNELNAVKDRLTKSENQYSELKQRLILVENNHQNVEISEDVKKPAEQKERDVVLSTSVSEDEIPEYDDSMNDIPKIPADLAARLGSF